MDLDPSAIINNSKFIVCYLFVAFLIRAEPIKFFASVFLLGTTENSV